MTDHTPQTLLAAIEKAKLIGRGGSGYSTAVKWRAMFEAHPKKLYIAVNGSEGEPGTKKDEFILKNYLHQLLLGLSYTYIIFPQAKKIYIYLRKDLYKTYTGLIEKENEILHIPLEVFKEPGGYLCGENTVLCNAIEGLRLEPRRKPPYISQEGIFTLPTLVNNVETFYRVYEIAEGKYTDTRFYSITGDAPYPGVYDLPNGMTLSDVLKKTKNVLRTTQFAQLGGGASGMYVTKEELEKTSANKGTGAILIYDAAKISFLNLLKEKLLFLINENCGKCTPCREGIYRLKELIDTDSYSDTKAYPIMEAMKETSYCGLGQGAGMSLLSLIEKKHYFWK